MVASMLRAQRRDPAKAQAKCAFATNYPLANRQLRSPLILRYQRVVASMLRAQRRDPAKAQAKCAFATNYPLANRQLRSPLILRYRMQRDKH